MNMSNSNKLERAYNELVLIEQMTDQALLSHDPRAVIGVTIVFLVSMLTLPLTDPGDLILFFIYPVWSCFRSGISYRFLLTRSLYMLPFIILIGIFNPILDQRTLFYIWNIPISQGWISFISILLRGILSVQAALFLIIAIGFYNFCRGLKRLYVPTFFITQLLFVYRYLFVLIREAISMMHARDSRSFGTKGYPLKMWGILSGQLMIRTFERAQQIHRAMLARGFNGEMQLLSGSEWSRKDTLYLTGWSLFILSVRLISPMLLLERL